MGPADLTAGGAQTGGAGADEMATTLKTAAESYLRAKALSRATGYRPDCCRVEE